MRNLFTLKIKNPFKKGIIHYYRMDIDTNNHVLKDFLAKKFNYDVSRGLVVFFKDKKNVEKYLISIQDQLRKEFNYNDISLEIAERKGWQYFKFTNNNTDIPISIIVGEFNLKTWD